MWDLKLFKPALADCDLQLGLSRGSPTLDKAAELDFSIMSGEAVNP